MVLSQINWIGLSMAVVRYPTLIEKQYFVDLNKHSAIQYIWAYDVILYLINYTVHCYQLHSLLSKYLDIRSITFLKNMVA